MNPTYPVLLSSFLSSAFRLISVFSVILYSCTAISAEPVNELNSQMLAAQQKTAKVQGEIDQLHEKTAGILTEYRRLTAQIAAAQLYQKQLESSLQQQEQTIGELKQQLQSVADIDQQINPLMLEMAQSLHQFIEADLPFVKQQRLAAVSMLLQNLGSLESPVSDKFQQVLDAYMTEDQYGRAMSTFQGSVHQNGQSIAVNFLRLGRVALYYQTLDQKSSARWSRQSQDWIVLDGASNADLKEAVQIALAKKTPSLVNFVLPKVQEY